MTHPRVHINPALRRPYGARSLVWAQKSAAPPKGNNSLSKYTRVRHSAWSSSANTKRNMYAPLACRWGHVPVSALRKARRTRDSAATLTNYTGMSGAPVDYALEKGCV